MSPHWSGVSVSTRASNDGYPKGPIDFTITEKAPTRALSWLKAPTSAFTFKTLLRHYAKWDADTKVIRDGLVSLDSYDICVCACLLTVGSKTI